MSSTVDGRKRDWIGRVFGAYADPAASAGPQSIDAKGPEAWRSARALAIQTLSALGAKIRAGDDPDRDKGVVILRAIQANLTEMPQTPQQILELARYIATDDVVAAAETPNIYGITVTLREPLLRALRGMR